MIILIVDDRRVAVLKLEGHSPVAADPDSVPPFILVLEGCGRHPGRSISAFSLAESKDQLVAQLVDFLYVAKAGSVCIIGGLCVP